MVLELNKAFATNKGDAIRENRWTLFISFFEHPDLLSAAEVERLKNMHDVFNALISLGFIEYGKYEALTKILSRLRLLQCTKIITGFEKEMKETGLVMKSYTFLTTFRMIFAF